MAAAPPLPPPAHGAAQPDSPSSWRLRTLQRTSSQWRAAFVQDPKRLIHSLKVGLTLSLVSLTLLVKDLFKSLGSDAIWAVFTVVVVLEYTVGGTLSKGLNRGLGTILAALLGLLVDLFADLSGPIAEPYIVGFSVFLCGMATTYIRFNPSIKAKYDYGVVIFLLTFCLVVVSGYRVPEGADLAVDRILTVALGCMVCVLVSICIAPIWAGDDLHDLIVNNFRDLAGALEECTTGYFLRVNPMAQGSSKICKGEPYADTIYIGYRAVLVSKNTEESLATFASWEPRNWRFGRMRYPWKQCVQVGALLRHCAYTVSALHGCVLSEIQAPESLRLVFAQPCIMLSAEVAKVLKEIGDDIRHSRKSRPVECLMDNLNRAVERLHAAVNDHPHLVVNPKAWPVLAGVDGKRIRSKLSMSTPEGENTSTVGESLLAQLPASDGVVPEEATQKDSPAMGDEVMVNAEAKLLTQQAADCRDFVQSLSVATVMSLLVEIVARVETLLIGVAELEKKAGFKELDRQISNARFQLSRPNTQNILVHHATVQITE